MTLSEKRVRVTRPMLFDEPVATDSRKFLKTGVLRNFATVIVIMPGFELRLPIPVRAVVNDVR